jgi:hypothetical protein
MCALEIVDFCDILSIKKCVIVSLEGNIKGGIKLCKR